MNLAATSFVHRTGQIFRGTSASQWTLEPLKGEHQHTVPSSAEVPEIHVARVFSVVSPLYVALLNSLMESR